MKHFIILIMSIISFTAAAAACDITITSDKTIYKKGETAVITVVVNQTHGVCPRSTTKPSFTAVGATVTAQTAFKEIKPAVYEIKFKVVVNELKASVTADKFCPKGGEKISLDLKVQ